MEQLQKLTSTRKGLAVLAVGVALLAALLIGAYIKSVRSSASQSGTPAIVLVAKGNINKGTPAGAIASQGLYTIAQVRHDQLLAGALATPGALSGILTKTVFRGEQLTSADFGPATTEGLSSRLSASERAVAIALDSQHGLLNELQAGDKVAVYVSFAAQGQLPEMRLLSQNVLVLMLERATGPQATTNVVLQARNGQEAGDWAYASDNGKFWLVLQPANGSKPQAPSNITAHSILSGPAPAGGK